jgi:hypothetical protein
MTSAWVITQEGPQHPAEVIGILSARKSGHTIKEYVEWLYALLHYHPTDHLDFARYNNPTVVYEAQFMITNTGVPVGYAMHCGDNPFLVARRAKNISLIETCVKVMELKWTNPDIRIWDRQTPPNIVERIPGAISQAPIHLPLRIGSGAPRLTRNMAAL